MRAVGVGLALLSLLTGAAAELYACTSPRPATPLIYERFTEGGRYVMAMVESPESYERSFKYQPTDEDRRILATYPRPGVYRVDDLAAPVLAFESPLEKSDLVGFFEHNDSAYLITARWATLRFYRANVLVREVSGYSQLEWIHAPWFYVFEICGGGPAVDFRLDETRTRRQVVVETPEGAQFRYDARTGRLVGVERLDFETPVQATPAEEDLASIVDRLIESVGSPEPDELTGLLIERSSDVVVQSCREAETLGEGEWLRDIDGADEERWAGLVEGLDFGAPGLDAHRGRRLHHRREGRFDLYRAPAGLGSAFLCGGDVLENDWLREDIDEAVDPAEAEQVFERAKAAFEGPTVAAITTWKAEGDLEEEADFGRFGVATLWSHATGEWKMIMTHVFVVPEASVD